MLLHLTQHAVDVEVIELQIEVGGDEAGKFVVVVLLVDLEELVVAGGHDAEAVLCQLLAEQRVELFELGGVGQVGHVDAQTLVYHEVLLPQLVLALLQAADELLLLVGVVQQVSAFYHAVVVLVDGLIVLAGVFLPGHVVVEGVHQRVIPGGGQVESSDVGVLEGVASLGCGGVAERTDVGQREGRHVHRVDDAVAELLHVDLRWGHRDRCGLFRAAGRYQASRAGH